MTHPAIICGLVGGLGTLAFVWFRGERVITARNLSGCFFIGFLLLAFTSIALGLRTWQYRPDQPALILGALAMLALGAWEEKHPIRLRWKLVGQTVVASGIFYLGIRVVHFKNPFTGMEYELGAISYLATIIWIVGALNVVHLLDAIEDLSHTLVLFLMALLALLSYPHKYLAFCIATGMAGGLLALVIGDACGKRIHLGKGGSYLLGSLAAMMALRNSNKGTLLVALFAPLVILCLPLLQATASMRRTSKQGVFRTATGRMHADLMQIGFSKVNTIMIIHDLSIVALALAFALSWSQGRSLALTFGFLFLMMVLSTVFLRGKGSAAGRVFQSSLEVRRNTDYALSLSRLLEAEAERSSSLDELWKDYVFLMRRLGFDDARLVSNGPIPQSQAAGGTTWVQQPLAREEFLELAVRDHKDPQMTNFLGTLAAEIWINTKARWIAAQG